MDYGGSAPGFDGVLPLNICLARTAPGPGCLGHVWQMCIAIFENLCRKHVVRWLLQLYSYLVIMFTLPGCIGIIHLILLTCVNSRPTLRRRKSNDSVPQSSRMKFFQTLDDRNCCVNLHYYQHSAIVVNRLCRLSIGCDANVLWQNGWS